MLQRVVEGYRWFQTFYRGLQRVIEGSTWLQSVIEGYRWFIQGYKWFIEVIEGLQMVIQGLQMVIGGYKRLYRVIDVTKGYKGLQMVTKAYRGGLQMLKMVIKAYRWLQEAYYSRIVTGLTVTGLTKNYIFQHYQPCGQGQDPTQCAFVRGFNGDKNVHLQFQTNYCLIYTFVVTGLTRRARPLVSDTT